MTEFTTPIFIAKDFVSTEELIYEPVLELPLPKGTWISPQDKRITNY